MPLGVGESVGGEASSVGISRRPPYADPGRLTCVIVKNEENIWRVSGAFWDEWRPVRFGNRGYPVRSYLEAAHEFSFGRLRSECRRRDSQKIMTIDWLNASCRKYFNIMQLPKLQRESRRLQFSIESWGSR